MSKINKSTSVSNHFFIFTVVIVNMYAITASQFRTCNLPLSFYSLRKFNAHLSGSLPAIFIMEAIMEHVAKSINKDPLDIRMMNMYTDTQVCANSLFLLISRNHRNLKRN